MRAGTIHGRGREMTFEGRVALVTGAARGIGLAIAERFVSEGASVTLIDREAEAVKASAQKIGPAALPIAADLTRSDDVERAVREAHERWGRLDIVVNNAAITGRTVPLWELSDR